MRWDKANGFFPRGYRAACGNLEEVELVLVVAEPGDPHEKRYPGLESDYENSTRAVVSGPHLFDKNIRFIIEACWPELNWNQRLRKFWMTESVLCSAPVECGPVKAAISKECGVRYLKPQLELLKHALVVALGRKAESRLRAIGYYEFLPACAVAPPGCNNPIAKESWQNIAYKLKARKGR